MLLDEYLHILQKEQMPIFAYVYGMVLTFLWEIMLRSNGIYPYMALRY